MAASRTYTGPSREERADAALRQVLDLFESDQLPGRIAETVIVRATGEQPCAGWSLGNQLLCLLNGTTDARGFRQWKEVGRSVKKGAKAFSILGPVKRKFRDADPATGEETERVVVVGFKAIPVFRLEDTEGEPIETADYAPSAFPPLFEVAQAWGLNVVWGPYAGRFRGYYLPQSGRIGLATHDDVTFLHELGHAAHDRVVRARGGALKVRQDPRQEIVAELTAAVLCRLHGLDGYLPGCAEYVAHYGNGNPGRAAMQVLGDVQQVLALILATAQEHAGEPDALPVLEAVAA